MTARKARPKNVEGSPTMVQPKADSPSLDEVLADIDVLEATETPLDPDDARLIEDMDGDGSDFEDEPAPVVTKPKRTRKPAVRAAKRAGIPELGDDEGKQGKGLHEPAPRRERRTSNPTHARMSHKACGHPITGEAGKIARAECRARHRGEGEVRATA